MKQKKKMQIENISMSLYMNMCIDKFIINSYGAKRKEKKK